MPVDRSENLIHFDKLTEEEHRKIASNGGKRSGEVRAEKKRISQMYAEFLMEEFDITLPTGVKEKTSGAKLINQVTKAILSRGDSASVQMLKEIREATEGSKVELSGADGGPMTFQYVDPPSKNENTQEV